MRYIFGITLLLIFTSSFIMAQTSKANTNQSTVIEQELINLEREKDSAYERGDKVTLDRIYADDYIAITAAGTNVTKKEILGFFTRSKIFESHRSEDISVRIFGDTAIVTGLQKRKFARDIKPGGEDFIRYTHIYVRRQGEWKIVAAQFTIIKK